MGVNMSVIANEAKVGKATVSLALRNDPRLRPETCQRIQEIATRLGYVPNPIVANLMSQLRASKDPKYQATFGILNASKDRDALRTNPTFQAWTHGFISHCSELGYGADAFWLHEPGMQASGLLNILRTRNIQGVIIAGVEDHCELDPRFDALWTKLACVVMGLRPVRPPLHFVCNDQFSTAFRAAEHLAALGYRRPGLVLDPAVENNLDYRFSAGFYADTGKFEVKIPVFAFHSAAGPEFRDWIKTHNPDVVVGTYTEVESWLKPTSLQCPRDIGIVHLDLTRELEGWSGMKQNNHLVGAFAVDLLVSQIHRNEYGVPAAPRGMMVESHWVEGKTVRKATPVPKKRIKQSK